MSLRSRRPQTEKLNLATLAPPSQKALFQHSPSPGASIRKEWEPGCQPAEIYAKELSAWRNGLRLWLLRYLEWEKGFMPAWQKRVRTGGRDKFFYWTAVFGSGSLKSRDEEKLKLMSSAYVLHDVSAYVVLAWIFAKS
jgi:hypothetical protein